MPARESGADGGGERVNVFRVGERYLFRHFFDGEDVFDRLKPYYENQKYRFSVPVSRFEPIRVFLGERGYELRVVDSPREFGVVVKQYSDHPENVFKAAVCQASADGYNCFLLRDRRSVALAVKQGATRLVDTDIDVAFAPR